MMGVFVRQDSTEFGPQSDTQQAVAKSGSVGAITLVDTANGNGWWTTNARAKSLSGSTWVGAAVVAYES